MDKSDLLEYMVTVLQGELAKAAEERTDVDIYGIFDQAFLDLREAVVGALCEKAKEVDPYFSFSKGVSFPQNPILFNTVKYELSCALEPSSKVGAADYHVKLQGIFTAPQLEKIKSLHPVIIGVGATGEYTAQFFARLGTKGITLIDPDVFEPSNIGRTPFCCIDSIGRKKVDITKENLEKINPYLCVEIYDEEVSLELLEEVCCDKQFLHDACDDPAARALIHRYGRKNDKICFTTGCGGNEGRFTTFFPEDPYWEDVLPPLTHRFGVNINPLLPVLVATERVNNNIKLLTDAGEVVRYPYLLTINLLRRNPITIRKLIPHCQQPPEHQASK